MALQLSKIMIKTEPEDDEDSNIELKYHVSSATSIQPTDVGLIEPQLNIKEDSLDIPIKSEVDTELRNEDNDAIQPSQDTEPLVDHTIEKIYSCSICSFNTYFECSHAEHKFSHSLQMNQVRQCSVFLNRCDSTCSSSNTLPSSSEDNDPGHVVDMDQPGTSQLPRDLPYSCELCSYQCNSKRNLVDHKLSHALKKYQVNKCSVFLTRCDSTCSSSNTLPSSNEDHTEPSQDTDPLNNSLVPLRDLLYSCELCSYQGKSKRNLAQHKKRTHGKKKLYCGQCDYSTRQNSNLVKHQRIHSGERPYACDVCLFKTAKNSNLIRHKLRHFKEKRFKCQQCDYESYERRNLVGHMRTHSGERPFACDSCKYTCVQISHLVVHKRIHSLKKMFQCGMCDYGSHTKSNLVVHLSVHSKERPFACDSCTYTCSRSSSLVRHKRVHSQDQQFKCAMCDFGYHTKYNLVRHLRKHSGAI